MRIDDDFQVFRFARLFSGTEGEKSAALLCAYWKKCGTLKNLTLLLHGQELYPQFDELQYVLAAEICCEKVVEAMGSILCEKYCFPEAEGGALESDVAANAVALVTHLRALSVLSPPTRGKWADFYGELAKITVEIATTCNLLIGCGKEVRFCSNTSAEKILQGAVNYAARRGEYFLFRN